MKPLTAEEFEKRQLQTQIEVTKQALKPSSEIHWGLIEVTNLVEMIFNYLEKQMDKKMHKITEKMALAEKDIKKGKSKVAVKELKKAEKANEKLVKIDRDIRDPLIDKCKKSMKKGKK